MGRKQPEPEPEVDPTAFLLTSSMAGFFLMHTKEIKYMCMVAYTFLHGMLLERERVLIIQYIMLI